MNKLYVNFSDEIFKIDDKDYQDFQMDKYTKLLKNYLMCKSKEKDIFGYIVTRDKTIYPIVIINKNNKLIKITYNGKYDGFNLINRLTKTCETITLEELYNLSLSQYINEINGIIKVLDKPTSNDDIIMAWVIDK